MIDFITLLRNNVYGIILKGNNLLKRLKSDFKNFTASIKKVDPIVLVIQQTHLYNYQRISSQNNFWKQFLKNVKCQLFRKGFYPIVLTKKDFRVPLFCLAYK